MAFPTRASLQVVWSQLLQRAASLKRYCQGFSAASAARAVSASELEEMFSQLSSFAGYARSVRTTPGLAEYAKAQYADDKIDVNAEFTALLAAVDAAVAGIASGVPSASGYVLLDQWAADGTITRRSFSPDSLAPVRTALASVIAAIE